KAATRVSLRQQQTIGIVCKSRLLTVRIRSGREVAVRVRCDSSPCAERPDNAGEIFVRIVADLREVPIGIRDRGESSATVVREPVERCAREGVQRLLMAA